MTTTTVQGGEGSRRWRVAEGQTPQFLAWQYQPNFRHYTTVCVQYQYYDYYHNTRRWWESALASCRGTNAIFGIPILRLLYQHWYCTQLTTKSAIFGIPISRLLLQRWRLAEENTQITRNTVQYVYLYLYWYSKQHNTNIIDTGTIMDTITKVESVLTSRGGTQITQKYSWHWQYVYRTNSTISTVNDGVFDQIVSYNDNVRELSHKKILW